MEILEVADRDYKDLIRVPYHIFGAAGFNKLNKNKCDELFYLLFRDGKYRLGIIGGIMEGIFCSPFSAPFGGFSCISDDLRLQHIEEAIRSLESWALKKDISSISITLPPNIYSDTFLAKQQNCLWREGFKISEINLNYSFNLEHFNENYHERIWYNARKNLRISMNAKLQFCQCIEVEEQKIAYEIIHKNRESRGYPLRMSWQQVYETMQVVQVDCFLIYCDEKLPIASAIVFHVTRNIVQIIYWGDIPGYSELKPMNFISYKIFEYYKYSKKKIVDLGPSSEKSIPNYGLCEFKESIGCDIHTKLTLSKQILKINS